MCGSTSGAVPAGRGAVSAVEGVQPSTATRRISLTVNGEHHEFDVHPQETLVELLRERLRFMRTKEGCSVGECGSCTVIMDKKAVASCLVLAVDADGSNIVTTEGMSCDSEFSPCRSRLSTTWPSRPAWEHPRSSSERSI